MTIPALQQESSNQAVCIGDHSRLHTIRDSGKIKVDMKETEARALLVLDDMRVRSGTVIDSTHYNFTILRSIVSTLQSQEDQTAPDKMVNDNGQSIILNKVPHLYTPHH